VVERVGILGEQACQQNRTGYRGDSGQFKNKKQRRGGERSIIKRNRSRLALSSIQPYTGTDLPLRGYMRPRRRRQVCRWFLGPLIEYVLRLARIKLARRLRVSLRS